MLSTKSILPLLVFTMSTSSFAYTTYANCEAYPPTQSASYTDISGAISRWFAYSNTGASCTADDSWSTHCNAAGRPTTYCSLAGDYSVWDTQRMSCAAYNKLRTAAVVTCGALDGNGGYGDCACGVYAVSTAGSSDGQQCLIATFTYHTSGTGVSAPIGGSMDPAPSLYIPFVYNGIQHNVKTDEHNSTSRIDHSQDFIFEDDLIEEEHSGLQPDASAYPYPSAYSSQGFPTKWTEAYQGSCSIIN